MGAAQDDRKGGTDLAKQPAGRSVQPPAEPGHAGRPAAILHVNDDDASRHAITRALRQAGLTVDEAATGAEALRRAAAKPDLIILDVELPDISGFEVCRRIKADPTLAAIPVLHLSAKFVTPEHRVQCLDAGADGYLVQPFEPQELIATVRSLLRLREAERAYARQAARALLAADVVLALNQAASLRAALQSCAEALVRQMPATFARIWTLNSAGDLLELQASAGLYTHLDGAHSRIPVGTLEIGRIAQERRPHLSNDVLHDPNVPDPDWARREGIVAFAGYPLMHEARLLGVMAVFARAALAEETRATLGSVAQTIALGIERRQVLEDRDRLLVRERKARADAEAAEAAARVSARRAENLERELRTLARLAGSTTAVPSSTTPLVRDACPELFDKLVADYGTLMERALEMRQYKVTHKLSEMLHQLSDRLAGCRAGPRDVIEVHHAALQNKRRGAAPTRIQAYLEEGRLLLLELMGNLVSHYRKYAPAAAPNAPDPPLPHGGDVP